MKIRKVVRPVFHLLTLYTSNFVEISNKPGTQNEREIENM
jgi:hypothetical protein